MRGLSLVAASWGHSSSRCAGLSLSRPLLLQSTGSRRAGSVVVAHRPSCSAARGILPDQGSNPCPLHWQADPQPLRHQGSPLGASLIHVIHGEELLVLGYELRPHTDPFNPGSSCLKTNLYPSVFTLPLISNSHLHLLSLLLGSLSCVSH